MENGYNGNAVAYSEELQKTPPVHIATTHDAAFYFAHYGRGRKDPKSVRDIVTWLTKQIDVIAVSE